MKLEKLKWKQENRNKINKKLSVNQINKAPVEELYFYFQLMSRHSSVSYRILTMLLAYP